MKVLKVDHVGIAVKNLEESMKFYEEVLGLKVKVLKLLRSKS